MGESQVVTSPDGERWRIRRRWMDRGLPNVRKRFGKDREEATGLDALDAFSALDVIGDAGWAGLAIGVAVLLLVVILLPLLGVALELILLLLLFSSGLAGRVVLGRPWTVEAIDLDDGKRSVAYAVKGFRRASHAVDELATAIAASGPPERLAAGERTTPPPQTSTSRD